VLRCVWGLGPRRLCACFLSEAFVIHKLETLWALHAPAAVPVQGEVVEATASPPTVSAAKAVVVSGVSFFGAVVVMLAVQAGDGWSVSVLSWFLDSTGKAVAVGLSGYPVHWGLLDQQTVLQYLLESLS